MNKVHIVIPCGGAGSRFKKDDITVPKPLIELYGKPFFWWAAQSAIRAFPMKDITFIVLQEHIDEWQIDKKIYEYFPGAKISVLPYQLNGPVYTALSGISQFADGDPIVFQDCDHAMSCENFDIGEDVEAAIMSFKSREPHFGYIKYIGGKDTQYAGTVEKNPVSNYAIFGCYYFKNADVFAKAAVLYFNDGTQKEYYMSGLYNYLLNVKRIDVKEHFEFGTPDELKELKSEVSENELKGKLGL